MNKTMTTLAVAALTAVAAPVMAQSSVTLFGVIDLAARSVDNGATQKQLATNGLNSSRLGFRGTEDLGGGLKANFWLEGAVNADDGTGAAAGGGQNWQRRATLGLQGGFGEVRLGRQKNPTGLNWEQLDPFGDTGMGSSSRLQQSTGLIPAGGLYQSFPRSSNSISYDTPGTTGFFGTAFVAAGEGVAGNKYVGGRVGYRAGPLFAVVAYGQTQVTGSIDAEMLNFGATYDFKIVKLFGMYSTTEVGAAEQKNYLIGVSAPVGPVTMRASFNKMDGEGTISNRSAKHATVGGDYALSRRTALYANYSKISNRGPAAFTVATGSALVPGNGSSGYDVGVRHSF